MEGERPPPGALLVTGPLEPPAPPDPAPPAARPGPAIEPAGLSRIQAAAFLGVSRTTFDRLVRTDPGVEKARRYPTARAVYVRSLLEAWLADPRRGCPTTPPVPYGAPSPRPPA